MPITLDQLDSTVKFTRDIEELVSDRGVSYMEAVAYWCEKRGLEIEYAASLIKKNKNLKGKIQQEAEELNFMKKTARLPI